MKTLMKTALCLGIAAQLLLGCALGGKARAAAEASPEAAGPRLIVSFDYTAQSGWASNQFAVWIEGLDGNLVKTLYATRFTAAGGYKNRPDSLAAWLEKSGLSSMEKSEADAVTGPTPQSGALAYPWDLTDENGGPVPMGEYRFCVEGTLRWKNRALYTGIVDIGGGALTVLGEASFVYEAAESQPALTEASPENGMIGAVRGEFIPGKERP